MIELNPIYKPIFTTDKRYILVTGGRGSGKSFAVKTAETLLTYEPGHRILSTRYTLASAKDSVIPETTSKLDLLGVRNDFEEQKTCVKNLRTGCEILFRGIKTSSGSQTAKLKSLHDVSTWVVDEAEELVDEVEFDTIDFSIRSPQAQNRIIIMLNPTTKEHWIWQRWFENHLEYIEIDGFKIPVSNHPDVCHIHTTYLDNEENLPVSLLNVVRRLKEDNPSKYQHVILGGWREKAEGVIFPEWSEEEFDESLPSIWVMDFGVVDPTTLSKIAVDRKRMKLYIKEYMYQSDLSSSQIVKIVGDIVPSDQLIVVDYAEALTINDMINAGFNIQKAIKGKDSVKQGIRNMMNYELCVDPESMNAKRELNNYAWLESKSETPIDDYNHIIDPVRYGLQILDHHDSFFVM